MKKKMFKRVMSFILALILTMGQLSGTGMTVLADETTAEGTWSATEYVTNGDFETWNADEWTITFASDENYSKYEVKEGTGPNNGTAILNINNGASTGNAFFMTRTLTAVPAGTYALSFEYEGIADTASGLSVSVGGAAKAIPATTGWDVWNTFTTDAFTLTEAGDVTITIAGDLTAGYWGDFDNFVLNKYTAPVADDSEDTESTESTEEIEKTVLISNGDFETWNADEWTITFASDENWSKYEVKAGTGPNNGTAILNINNGASTGNAFSMTRTLTAVPAGTYALSFEYEGMADAASGLSVSVGGAAKAIPATTGWDVWNTFTTDSFTLTEASDVTITIAGDLTAGYWGDFDNFVLEEVEAPVEPAEPEGYKVVITPSATEVEVGSTVSLTAKVTYNGETITDLTAAELNLWWWEDTWADGHEDGKDDAIYSNYDENSGKSLTADVTLPSIGNYYICAEVQDANGTLVKEFVTLTSTAKDTDSYITGEISVDKIKNLSEDFIMGMDISSVMTQFASGVTYKDFEGNTIDNITDFCKFLAENGITHIRVRVWNDPFDANGNGYGGGNNDVATAAQIAEGCRAAGIKMLVDFHCSDFWADPGKQQAPKAWAGYTLEEKAAAVETFIAEALETIDPEQKTVDMVQVGNETTGSFVGETGSANMCTLFAAGAKAVRAYDEDVKVVIHITNPEKGNVTKWAKNLSDNSVDYDILATSYYSYWHGTLDNLKSEFKTVKETYGKDVMVAETSWAYTLEDSDGHDNTVRVGNNDTGMSQPFTVQGQANMMRDIMNAVSEVGGLGVFYWESAWTTVGDTTGLTGAELEAQIAENKTIWEKYGSGWASSFAGEYDAKDAGVWFGGSAVDNQAMFYPDGTPVASLYVWNYVKTGAYSKYTSVDDIVNPEVTLEAGSTLTLPGTVTVNYNSGAVEETVTWNTEDVKKVDTSVARTYTVNGTVTFSKTVDQGEYNGQKEAAVTVTVIVKAPNLIDANDAGFEVGDNYIVSGEGVSGIPAKDDPYAGKGSMHWYNAKATTGVVTYNKTTTLEPGKYNAELFTQGYAGDKVHLEIVDAKESTVLVTGDAAVLEGWAIWKTASVSFEIAEQTDVQIRIFVEMQDGGWGTADELYLYKETPAEIYTEVKVEGEGEDKNYVLSNEKVDVEGMELAGGNEVLADAKFDAEIHDTDSAEYKEAYETVKENNASVIKDDTKMAFLEVNLWAKDGTAIEDEFGNVTVSLNLPEALKGVAEVLVFRMNGNKLVPCTDIKIVDGKLCFTTNHFSTFWILEKDMTPGQSAGGNDSVADTVKSPATGEVDNSMYAVIAFAALAIAVLPGISMVRKQRELSK